MLTSLFYYTHYKPYIMRVFNTETAQATATRKPYPCKKTPQTQQNKVCLLNKSLKKDVVSYVRAVADSVVTTKDNAKNVFLDMEEFNTHIEEHGFQTAKNWIGGSLKNFVESYNDSSEFLEAQAHSQTLKNYGERISERVHYSAERLKEMGLSFDNQNKLSFDESTFSKLNMSSMYATIGENIDLFRQLYTESTNVLLEPLSDHMQFKSLGYYYNYKIGCMESDTFKIIESGLIIDRCV